MGKGKKKENEDVKVLLKEDNISSKESEAFLRKLKDYHAEQIQKGESLKPPRFKSEQGIRDYVSKWCPDGIIQDRIVAEIWRAIKADVPPFGHDKWPTYAEGFSPMFAGVPEKATQVTTLADGSTRESWTLRDNNNGKRAYQSAVHMKLEKGLNEDELAVQRRQFFNSLTPYTEKVLYLLFRKALCGGKGNMCVVDMNNDLDELGYTRDKSNCHHSANKRKYVEAINNLSMITVFATVIYKRKDNGKKSMDWNFRGSLIASEETNDYDDADTGRKIKQHIEVTIHPKLSGLIARNIYTWVPDDIAAIDIRKYPYAVRIHGYINHQWTVSYKQKHGCIRHSLRQILIGANVLNKISNRNPQRLNFIKQRLRECRHLVKRGSWKSFRKVEGHRDPLDNVYEIILPDNHGLHLLDDSSKQPSTT